MFFYKFIPNHCERKHTFGNLDFAKTLTKSTIQQTQVDQILNSSDRKRCLSECFKIDDYTYISVTTTLEQLDTHKKSGE